MEVVATWNQLSTTMGGQRLPLTNDGVASGICSPIVMRVPTGIDSFANVLRACGLRPRNYQFDLVEPLVSTYKLL